MSRHEQRATPEEPPVVVRDRRKIDPVTGAVRTPDSPDDMTAAGPVDPAGEPAAGTEGADELQAQLTERTNDLQRVTAEYANYRRRVDRDRETVGVSAKATVVTELLPVLDDIERAATHGDLNGAFKAVADKLTGTLDKIGLASFGAEGDPFDPAVHQAVQHATSPEVGGPTVTAVLRRGYQLGDRLLRPAMVAVTDHEPDAEPTTDNGPASSAGGEAGGSSGDPADDQPLWAAPGVDHSPTQPDQS